MGWGIDIRCLQNYLNNKFTLKSGLLSFGSWIEYDSYKNPSYGNHKECFTFKLGVLPNGQLKRLSRQVESKGALTHSDKS